MRDLSHSVPQGHQFGEFDESIAVDILKMVDDFIDDEVEDRQVPKEKVFRTALGFILQQGRLDPFLIELPYTLLLLLTCTSRTIIDEQTQHGIFNICFTF